MDRIKISAVSYTNSKPFIYGLEHASGLRDKMDIVLDVPVDCARKLLDNRVDIGLVPTAVLPEMPWYELVSDYCIGAGGPVNSVFIFSNKPLDKIRTVRTDSHSRTSNLLARILARHHWELDMEFGNFNDPDAFVLIGDRTFGLKEQYPYVFDLAEHWMNFTGLPFVFAVWAASKPVDKDFAREFSRALKLGLDRREALLKELPPVPGVDLHAYLMQHIDYNLDERKKSGLDLFLQFVKEETCMLS